MKGAFLVFPHQLFEEFPFSDSPVKVFIIEEPLFFTQYRYHKHKLVFHRASMKFYEDYLQNHGYKVEYVDYQSNNSDIRNLIPFLHKHGFTEIYYTDVTDTWLSLRIKRSASASAISLFEHRSLMFLNSREDVSAYFGSKRVLRQTDFYIRQRRRWNIMTYSDGKPEGGKWTYDTENRKRYPSGKRPPGVSFPAENRYYHEAIAYVEKNFTGNKGIVSEEIRYPVTFDEARKWFTEFLEERFFGYGTYQDSILEKDVFMHHSVLSPLLNTGLITPEAVIQSCLDYFKSGRVPINSAEGFIRQILGWREFIRGVYEDSGTKERTMNFWGFKRRIPESFWKADTGIAPVDSAIRKVLDTGYCHHIERLMVIGNFMLLCEFDPDEVYRWFMEMFIDAYDWVMVPNVYGMSQFSDGGLMATKPYISGSNYLMKMGDYRKGSWQEIWDGLFWRFMHVHRDFFISNPRLGLLVRSFDRMDAKIRQKHLKVAEGYLSGLDQGIDFYE